MTQPVPEIAATNQANAARHAARRVVMVTSPGPEASLADVATNLATVCAEAGQRVVMVSTSGLASPEDSAELPHSTPLWWKNWPSPGSGADFRTEERGSLLSGPLNPAVVEDLLGDTGVPGVSRLDLRYFVGHPTQVVVRVPDVLDALRQIVDVVILEVPSYLSIHHGEGLTPLVDVVLVVGERESTTVAETKRMSASLRRLGAPVVGMALTNARWETDLWGVDSELETDDETDDEPPSGDRDPDPTEQVPVAKPAGVVPAVSLDDLSVVHHAPPEA